MSSNEHLITVPKVAGTMQRAALSMKYDKPPLGFAYEITAYLGNFVKAKRVKKPNLDHAEQ